MSVHFSTAASGSAAGALYRPAATGSHGCHRPPGRDDTSPRREAARTDDDAGAGPRRSSGLAEALRAALAAYAAGAASAPAADAAASATTAGSTAALPAATTTSDPADAPPPTGASDSEGPAPVGAGREVLRDFTHALLDALRDSGAREVGHGPGRHLQRGHAWGRGGGDLAQRLEALAQRLAGGGPAEASGNPPAPGDATSPTGSPAPSATDSGVIPGAAPTDPSAAPAAQAVGTPTPAGASAGAGAAEPDTPAAEDVRSFPSPASVEATGSSDASAPAATAATSAVPAAPTASAASVTPVTPGPDGAAGPLSALQSAFASLWAALPASSDATRADPRSALAGFLHALAAGLGGAHTYGGASPYGERATAGVLLQARA